ncbi:MAG TPA: SpoIIE family protein phosphatase [Planctomycetaceae bacterium]|nr:SpoIIE family protein phosphatase [Planctomycetaceae bacterium]
MAFLRVLKGATPGQILELHGERVVLGRHPNCQIVLDNAAVSRHHAQILESHGNFYLEDLRSRNRTFLNGAPIEGRTELGDRDEVKVCDVVFRFHREMPPLDSPPPTSDSTVTIGGTLRDPDSGYRRTINGDAGGDGSAEIDPEDSSADIVDGSSIISTLDVRSSSSSLRLSVKPEAKLRAVLEIANALASVLRLDDVLQKILDGLFKVFPQADDGCVVLKDPETGKLAVRARKSRLSSEDSSTRISMTVVRQALETGEAILSADAIRDSRFELSDSLTELKIRSMLCVPLLDSERKPQGVIQIDTRNLRQKFSQSDLEVLVSVAAQASLAVENSRLHEILVQQRDIQRDLEVATQIQLGFLPNKRPKLPGFEFYDYYEAAQMVGGDYFDYVTRPDGRVAIAVADVAGKGIPAALLMARLYSSARIQLLTHDSAGAAMTALNAEIATSGLGYRFITCVVVLLDPQASTVAIANAGHLPPYLRSPRGKIRALAEEVSGMPLGVAPSQQFGEAQVEIKPEEVLVLYTDGITEAMNPKNQLYGGKRLRKYLSGAAAGAEDLVKGLVTDVEAFCHERSQKDDMCIVCLQRTE